MLVLTSVSTEPFPSSFSISFKIVNFFFKMRSHARNCGTCLPILASRKLRLDTDRSVPSWATQLGVGGWSQEETDRERRE